MRSPLCLTVLALAGLVWTLASAPPARAQDPSGTTSPTELPLGGAETLRFEPPADWVEVFRDDQPSMRIVHLVPPGQTRDAWQDIVTVQVLKTATPPTLETLHARAEERYGAACKDMQGGALQRGETNGLETGFWTLGCGLNSRSGKGEMAFFKAIRGQEGVYLVQRAWRLEPFNPAAGPAAGPAIAPDAQRAAIEMLTGAIVCVPGDANHPCP